MRVALVFFLLCLMVPASRGQDSYVTVKRNVKLMGSPFEFTVVAQNEEIGYINIEEAVSEVRRIEQLISSWFPESETSLINRNAGIGPVKVSQEVFQLIERAIQISEITEGAFDISYGALAEIWKFDGSMKRLPTDYEILDAISKVGYHDIQLNPESRTVFLKKKGMKIGFEAIGKGYAADRAKEYLVSKQVRAGMINAAGDLTTWGTKSTGENWLFGIANPEGSGKLFSWLPVVESAVATTGLRERYVIINGLKYNHILDPRSGYPVMGISKVTVLSKTAELADALATAVYVLGKEKGVALINQLGGTQVIIEDSFGKLYTSTGVLLNTQ